MNGEPLDLLVGETSDLETQERKLLAELEEGGEDYVDKELWVKVTSGGKRKMKADDNNNMTEVKPEKPEIEVSLEVGQKPERQRLMTDYHESPS